MEENGVGGKEGTLKEERDAGKLTRTSGIGNRSRASRIWSKQIINKREGEENDEVHEEEEGWEVEMRVEEIINWTFKKKKVTRYRRQKEKWMKYENEEATNKMAEKNN